MLAEIATLGYFDDFLRVYEVWFNANLACISFNAPFFRYTPDNSLDKEEHKFVTDFNCDVVVPGVIPPWLWGGQRISWHPKMWLRHDPPLVEREGDVAPSIKDEGLSLILFF